MVIIDGKETAMEIKQEIAKEVKRMMAAGEKQPHLAAILVGHDGGSETYVANKVKACDECGFKSTLIRFEDDVTEDELLQAIDKLNHNDDVDGFIVQLPLPRHIDEQKVIEAIDYKKDVDGFHPINVGRMSIGLPCFRSATPQGILALLERYGIETSGKHCVVLGRSNIVGKPVAQMLLQKDNPGNCTVTVCHSATEVFLIYFVCATGLPTMVVIDVGTTRLPSTKTKSGFKLYGDVDFDEVAPLCSFITPVPGGVGPMTICALMKNTLLAAQHKIYQK